MVPSVAGYSQVGGVDAPSGGKERARRRDKDKNPGRLNRPGSSPNIRMRGCYTLTTFVA